MKSLNPSAGLGIAVREYPTDTGPVDYALFLKNRPIGVIEAKSEDKGSSLTQAENTSLDIFWLKDESLSELDNLPDPDILA